jgi:single-strand DNA-binding protein
MSDQSLVRNLVVLRGTLVAVARLRELPSGSAVAQFDITTRDDTGTQSVPVAWFDPPPTVTDLEAGAELVVVGSVRRRFFRAGGATQSRTEVVATKVVPTRRGRDVRRALDAAARLLCVETRCPEEAAVGP